MYEERFYRQSTKTNHILEVSYQESDLLILSSQKIPQELAQEIVKKYYDIISEYITFNKQFQTSLSPLKDDPSAPEIVKAMLASCNITGIGPFASVAGAIAQYVGQELLSQTEELIIENGGDLFLKINKEILLGVYLGRNFKLNNLTLKIKPRNYPFGIASSSAYIGHSLNFGKADLVTVIAKDAIIADGLATSLSNQIKKPSDAQRVIALAKDNFLIEGLLIAVEEKIFLWGDIELR